MKNKLLAAITTFALLTAASSAFAAAGSEFYHFNCQGNHDNDNGDTVTCSFQSDSRESWHWTTLEVQDSQGGKFQCGTGSGDSEKNGVWVMSSPSNNAIKFTCRVN